MRMMMLGGGKQSFLLLLLLSSFLLLVCIIGQVSCDDSLQTKCSQSFTKLSDCLSYATEKSNEPTSTCCTSVSGIRSSQPECLCYIIQQTHDGLQTIKQLGLQFSRLVQLPAACKLANSSISDCPQLLNLSPSSPDYGIFTNTTKATNTPTSTGSATTTPKSDAVMHKVRFAAVFTTAILSAIFLSSSLIEA